MIPALLIAVTPRLSGEPAWTVLVVDDEPGPREALRMVLKPHFRVLTACGGEDAIEMLRREEVDVVTLDLRMPELDGVQTLERIRQVAADVEVVVITGFGDRDSVMDTIYLGAFSYINKPFHMSDILETIRQACEQRRSSLGVHAGR